MESVKKLRRRRVNLGILKKDTYTGRRWCELRDGGRSDGGGR